MGENDLGQLLILKVNELRWNSSLERLLRRLRPGGVLIDAPLVEGAGPVGDFLFKVVGAVAALPFLVLKEEGGTMHPLRAFLPPLASPLAAADRGLAAVRRLGELVGAALQPLGFNTDLAPLLDLASPAIGGASQTHAFSASPQQVAKWGEAFLQGLKRHEIRACGKHFPGQGSARATSATELPMVSKSMAELWREDLVPYRALLPRLPLVLLSTAAYKAYDFDLLQSAGLSAKVVEGLLRVKLGYHGVAIACGLEAEAVRGALSLEDAAVQAVRVGCDMLLLEEAEAAEQAQTALLAAREFGKLSGSQVEQALKRIQIAKQGLKLPPATLPKRSLDRIAKEFIDFSSEFTDYGECLRGCRPVYN